MSKFFVYLNAPNYIQDWLKHDYWEDQSQQVIFPRGSAPRAVLQAVLRPKPHGGEEIVHVVGIKVSVPTVRGVAPEKMCYLNKTGHNALLSACKILFRATLYAELKDLFSHDIQITDIIYDFMDRHGIDASDQNWETIRQMYYRMRKKSLSNVDMSDEC